MNKTTDKVFQTLDIYLSSFLSMSGFHPKLEVNDSGKVIFVFTLTDDLATLMVVYNNNVPVPVADFVTTLKTLRGQMLTRRGTRQHIKV